MYVEDCAKFVVDAAYSNTANGEILNAGLGEDITINELAEVICEDKRKIRNIEHIHPQSEIPKLLCDYSKAKKLLGWEPKTSLKEGIRKTQDWMKK
jgi:nucleoside-diphosphate-sugar epimerase